MQDSAYRSFMIDSPYAAVADGCSWARGYVRYFNCRAEQQSALFRWRGDLPRLWDAVVHGYPMTYTHGQYTLREDGHKVWIGHPLSTLQAQITRGLHDEGGPPQVKTQAFAQFAAFVGALQAYHVPVIAFEIPYSPTFTQAAVQRWSGFETDRHTVMRSLAAANHIPLVEVSHFGSWWGDGMSHDIKHLSGQGALAFTQQLWNRPQFRTFLIQGLQGKDPLQ
jgi:hypothetical protein